MSSCMVVQRRFQMTICSVFEVLLEASSVMGLSVGVLRLQVASASGTSYQAVVKGLCMGCSTKFQGLVRIFSSEYTVATNKERVGNAINSCHCVVLNYRRLLVFFVLLGLQQQWCGGV